MTLLPPTARRPVAATAVFGLGAGLVLPVLLVYLHQVRHIPLAHTGLLLAVPGLLGLAAVPVSGVLVDRWGAGRVLPALLAGTGAAQYALGRAHGPAPAAAALALGGLCFAPVFSTLNTLLAGLCPVPAEQNRAFAVSFAALNAGLGVGSVLAGLLAHVDRPASFPPLFAGDAACCLLAAATVLRLPGAPGRLPGPKAGYREVFAVPALRRLTLVSLLLAMTGYAAVDAGLPAFGTVVAGVSLRTIALSLSANTSVIVLAQLPVQRLLRGRRRSGVLAATGLVWALSWAFFGCSALPLGRDARSAVVVAFGLVFGLGETLLAASLAPLVNAIADDASRGRANALSNATYSVAFLVSPALSAGLISAGLAGGWIALLCMGSLAVTVLSWRLRLILTDAHDGLAARRGDPLPVAGSCGSDP